MAQKRMKLDEEAFFCCICLELLKDPLTSADGQSYCLDCVEALWDEEDEEEHHGCPECTKTFTPKPDLLENTTSADFGEQLKKRYFADVTTAVLQVRDELQDFLGDEWTEVDVLLPEPEPEPEPKTRAGFLEYSRGITLDPNTPNRLLTVSDGDRKATLMNQHQCYSSHPDRFTGCEQVLSRERLTGRCYWEVEWSGGGGIVAVAYKNISREEGWDVSGFGYNNKSWALTCHNNSYNFWYNSVRTPVSGPQSSRIGVYLDHRAGVLSFYSVSDTMTLLHRVQTTFTQPLYAGLSFYFNFGDTAEFCNLK
ncbi:tripartite motif-containing protein 16-like protein [Clinocottus analis]|uniref:tripartite motif-containing protein 16-like protein n=1 Tax=Clinocottus analis TaxID=304258 RepID=UPI0035BF0AFB